MICPNCGRVLPDDAQVCPGCQAVQHAARRRRLQAVSGAKQDESFQRVVRPDEASMRQRAEEGRASTAAGSRRESEKPPDAPKASGSRGPVYTAGTGTAYVQSAGQVRRVRRAPEHTQRKLDAQPMLSQPPLYRKSHRRLMTILAFIMGVIVFVSTGAAYVLFESESGQTMLAEWGWDAAPTSAYVTLGREKYDMGLYESALQTLSVAVEREPENVDALVLMAQTYTELGQLEEAVDIYESLINDIAPGHPSAYRNLIRIYQQQGYNAEALVLMRQAAENATSTQEFTVMLREYTPTAPTISYPSGVYNEEIDVKITIPANQTVYYTTDGTDPSESGLVYTMGTNIHVPEGRMTIKAIGFTADGMPSEQVTESYNVIIPTPAAPKANYQSGSYKTAPKVSLRPGGETDEEKAQIVAMYYTLDGRAASTDSTLYTGPIQIPVGKSTLRAIAVDANGRVSYEMQVSYDVQGNLKKMFSSADTFKNMELYKTGYNTFVRAWGTPDSYDVLPEEEWYDEGMESSEAVYSWGTARFLKKTASGSPVLYALDTRHSGMTAPRSTKVGMDGDTVVEKFRDLGHPVLDDLGNRLLYNWNSQGYQFGSYQREADGCFAIHYYYPVNEKNTIFVELSYYLNDEGKVARIVWQRYVSEIEP